ncbi:MAG: DUF3006 domain-containing protein [Clostridia bacterium]|nr:DUF3006 domain-containing protein [Clostridia bacterium]
MICSIDRLTDLYAVCICETGEKRLIPRTLIDGGAIEGAVLIETENGRFLRDPAREQAMRRQLHDAAQALFDAPREKK